MFQRPNVLFILADDMGYGDFGCFNGGVSQTPTIDQLVAEGTCLTQHYSASPVCAPARASLLTGRYPHRTGVIDTLELRGLDRLALRERTVADLLRQAGYVTGLVTPNSLPILGGEGEGLRHCGGSRSPSPRALGEVRQELPAAGAPLPHLS
jgi:arylsulfatase A